MSKTEIGYGHTGLTLVESMGHLVGLISQTRKKSRMFLAHMPGLQAERREISIERNSAIRSTRMVGDEGRVGERWSDIDKATELHILIDEGRLFVPPRGCNG